MPTPPPPPDSADPAAPSAQHRFPCDNCGADFRFAPQQGLLICDHCGNSDQVEEVGPWAGSIKELDFKRAIENQLPAQDIEETRVSKCDNCGAQVEFDEVTHSKECPLL